MTLNKQNKQNKEQKMLKVTVKYQNTNVRRDTMMGSEWLEQRSINLDNDFINENYSNVAIHNLPESHPWGNDYGLCEALWTKHNEISTDELKQSKGFDAVYTHDVENSNWEDKGYIGHTFMYVGDIITIENESGETKVYFCDRIGFKQINA